MSEQESFTLPAEHLDPGTPQQVFNPDPVTPQRHEILQEIRSVSARLDGFNMRLGDMERSHRLQSQPASPSPSPRPLAPTGTAVHVAAPSGSVLGHQDQDPGLPDSVTVRRGRARPDAAIPPHMTGAAAALASTAVSAPPRLSSILAPEDSPNPLERYKSMTKGEKSNVRRALAGLGLTVPTFMDLFADNGGEDDLASAAVIGNDRAQPADNSSSSNESPLRSSTSTNVPVQPDNSSSSNESPLRSSTAAHVPVQPDTSSSSNESALPATEHHQSPTSTPTTRIEPAPNIGVAISNPASVPVSTRPMTCKTEWIGEFNGDPSQL
ncbi:hypothetical protein A4X03_0g9630, partial [Tilletia caries]